MAKGLEEIANLYLPEIDAIPDEPRGFRPSTERPAALPIITVPVEGRDAVRAAFAWNLTVELARLGAHATLVVPDDPESRPFWPEAGRGPLGARAHLAPVQDVVAFSHAALESAVHGAADATEGGVVVAAIPPRWLCGDDTPRPLLRWLLLLGTPDPADLCEAYGLIKLATRRGGDPRVGLVIHGVRRRAEAEAAFDRVANLASRQLGRDPESYGLLADDLHVYRAITARRPIGLEHPQSRAARALRDVAGMLWEDARKREE